GATGGIGQLLSPSFGYILGALPVGWFVGKGISRYTSRTHNGLVMMVGILILYTVGITYQYSMINGVLDTPVKLSAILATNLTIFLPVDVLKVFAATVVFERLKKLSFYKRIDRY
ncbi:MAG: biotin transporter BioY, partial [Alkalibacterium sp.]